MNNSRKISADFMNEREAQSAIDKISSHCKNIRIAYNAGYNYDKLDEPRPDYYDYNFTGGANWTFNPFGAVNYSHTHTYNYLSSLTTSMGRTTLEAEVPFEKLEYVKDKLYSVGAMSVI